jgi:hypothetical protein
LRALAERPWSAAPSKLGAPLWLHLTAPDQRCRISKIRTFSVSHILCYEFCTMDDRLISVVVWKSTCRVWGSTLRLRLPRPSELLTQATSSPPDVRNPRDTAMLLSPSFAFWETGNTCNVPRQHSSTFWQPLADTMQYYHQAQSF